MTKSSYSQFDNISSLDYRYWDEEVAKYLSENAYTRYKLLVELALVKILNQRGLCSREVVKEMEKACSQVTTEEVYAEEKRIGHDIRALVNCIRNKVNDETKPYVHMMATSYDIIDSANAVRYKDVVKKVVIPVLLELEQVLINITLREAETPQVGRTHGQHAVPITFGFAIAEYVNALGYCIESLQDLVEKLRGKFSGAVGAYNASSLFFDDPEKFEIEVLSELGLNPAEHATQIVRPESMTRLLSEIIITAGVLANLADDMRHLQRTEIGEIGEEFKESQVGSSTMPQKRNPINFENVKGSWEIIAPRIITAFMAQISEHQRDLTNSAPSRTHGEIIGYFVSMTKRLTRTMRKLKVDHESLKRNLNLQKGLILAEPLYIILAALGHPDAHEKVRLFTLQAQREQKSLEQIIALDPEMMTYMEKMTPYQKNILSNPMAYTGKASHKALRIAEQWRERLGIFIS